VLFFACCAVSLPLGVLKWLRLRKDR